MASRKAIFVACEEAEPARALCERMRAAGLDVWLGQSDLRGGDAGDESIRAKIMDCAFQADRQREHRSAHRRSLPARMEARGRSFASRSKSSAQSRIARIRLPSERPQTLRSVIS